MTFVRYGTWDEILLALADPELQIGLAGPPGVGKTYGAMMCRLHSPNKKLARITHKIQCHSELSPAEAFGFYAPVEQTFEWIPGPIDLCYSKGGLLVIDEIVEASGPVKTYLYGAMDRGPGGTISYVGRVFEQKPGYQVVATMNEWPDHGGLPAALLDRFDGWFIVTQPSEAQLQLLEPDLRDICRDSYDEEVVTDVMVGPSLTFRMLLGYQRMRKILPMEVALLSACKGNKTLAQSLYEVLLLTEGDDDEDVVATGVSAASGTAGEEAWTDEEEEGEDTDSPDEEEDDEDWDDNG